MLLPGAGIVPTLISAYFSYLHEKTSPISFLNVEYARGKNHSDLHFTRRYARYVEKEYSSRNRSIVRFVILKFCNGLHRIA